MNYFLFLKLNGEASMIKKIQEKINLIPLGEPVLKGYRPGLKQLSRLRPILAVPLYCVQRCSYAIRYILKALLSCGWPLWYENMSLQTAELPANAHKPCAFCCSFLAMAYIMQRSLNRWTVVWDHVMGAHLCFLFLELRAHATCFSGLFMLCFI